MKPSAQKHDSGYPSARKIRRACENELVSNGKKIGCVRLKGTACASGEAVFSEGYS